MPMITCNNLYVHTVEHLATVWGKNVKTSHNYYELSIDDRMKFVSGSVIPTMKEETTPTTEFPIRHATLRPTTAEVLAVPTYAAQLGLSPLGIFR